MQILYKYILLFPYKKNTHKDSNRYPVHFWFIIKFQQQEDWLVILLRELKSEYEKRIL
ncbi:unnamed protein product [Paramecium primaurelia]|uniref:Uncharacterized protein n=1 Tax=Paramecium primaurelia TaxID=5886 RepID=A0A8S1QNI8_PARPR|nr:unnamed protein product [Paramecium primaurelia]